VGDGGRERHHPLQLIGKTGKGLIMSQMRRERRSLQRAERKAADARRFAAIDSRLIPQFATGGISSGGLAILHDREMVLTPMHQSAIAARAGDDIFRSVGVPGVKPNADFDNGGIYSRSSSQGGAGPVIIDRLFISVDAEGIAIEGMSGRNGEQVIINAIENVNLRKGRR
jgi:hypothetical protein